MILSFQRGRNSWEKRRLAKIPPVSPHRRCSGWCSIKKTCWISTGSCETRAAAIKDYFIRHSEQVFALLIIVSVAAINYLIPYKLVFLNFFFIVILLGAYYLETHKAILGGVLTTLLVIVYVYYFPSSFMAATTERDLWLNILAWSSFLILTGAVVGQLIHRLKTEVQQLKKLKQDMQAENEKLEEWVAKLVR